MSTNADPRALPDRGPAPDEFRSDAPTHPGEILRRELTERGMTQAELAARASLSTKHVNQVLHGSALMSADVAIALERVLGTPASIWTRLDARWQEERSRERARQDLLEVEDWSRQFPLDELVKRGLLTGKEPGPALIDALLRLFRVVSPTAFERVWLGALQGSFRRAQQFDGDQYAMATWLMLAERQAERLDTQRSFNVSALRRTLPQLRQLTMLGIADGFVHARRILARCGVALVFVESIHGCRAHGATWWVAPNRPILALSERHKREDIFWFSLFHEIAHLLLHPRRAVFVNFERAVGDDLDGRETEANEVAAETLIPREYDRLISTMPVTKLQGLANDLEVGVSVVAGRKAHLTDQWKNVSRLRRHLDVNGLRGAAESDN